MAKEINTNLKVTIAGLTGSQSTAQGNVQSVEDVGGPASIGLALTIGIIAAAVTLPAGITTPAILYIQNTDPINFVTFDNLIGLTAWPQKILPGRAAILRPLNATLFAKADQAPVKVWIVAG